MKVPFCWDSFSLSLEDSLGEAESREKVFQGGGQ